MGNQGAEYPVIKATPGAPLDVNWRSEHSDLPPRMDVVVPWQGYAARFTYRMSNFINI